MNAVDFDNATPMYAEAAAVGCLIWYVVVNLVCFLGTIQIYRHYTRLPARPASSHLSEDDVPHVTIIRPCRGLEPYLYECLASLCYQDYPWSRFTIHLCVASRSDLALPIITRLKSHYRGLDIRIFIEDEDPHLQATDIGPNPKIRNMSRAYREAKGDVVWILDCNIWVDRGACGRLVDKLCGFDNTLARSNVRPEDVQRKIPYKLVAHLPVAVSVDDIPAWVTSSYFPSVSKQNSSQNRGGTVTGSLMEQSFLSSSHAKMYVAINTVAIAPCINGKSTAFRRSHLDFLTQGKGIDYFGENICEDHLIGDLLWRSVVPPAAEDLASGSGAVGGLNDAQSAEERRHELTKTNPRQLTYRNHGLVLNDLAIQPISSMSISAYIARRVRWLRVRKFTVPAATLVEPATESFVCSALGALGATTSRYTRDTFGQTWTAALVLWISSVVIWCIVDYFVFGILQGGGSVTTPDDIELPSQPASRTSTSTLPSFLSSGQHTRWKPLYSVSLPPFVKPPQKASSLQNSSWLPPTTWLSAWFAREAFALPIWTWAIWGGTTVTWRDQNFWVGMDMRVHAVDDNGSRTRPEHPSQSTSEMGNSAGARSDDGGIVGGRKRD